MIGRKKGGKRDYHIPDRRRGRQKQESDESKDAQGLLDDIMKLVKPDDEPDIRRKGGKKGRGLTNGRGLVNGEGYINGRRGKGLVNGKGGRGQGLVNGEGLVNGKGRKSRGRVNGLINGNGLVNGRGRVNGLVNGLGLTNGLVNGRGAVNGLVNGMGLINGTQRLKDRGKFMLRRRGKPILKFLFIILVFLIPTLLFFFYIDNGEYIKIDGKFDDWKDVEKIPDAKGDSGNMGVDLIEYAILEELDLLSMYVKVQGDLFTGGPSPDNYADVVNIFIDSDGSPDSGYRIDGIGADYMATIYGLAGEIHTSGLFEFRATRDPLGTDWNAFSSSFAVSSAAMGSELELQVFTEDIGWTDEGRIRVHARGWDEHEDLGDYNIGIDKGVLYVRQEAIGVQVLQKTANTELLELNLKAVNGDAKVEFITLTKMGTASITSVTVDGQSYSVLGNMCLMTFSPPMKIKQGETKTLDITANLASVTDGETLGFKIALAADIKAGKTVVTLESHLVDYIAYVGGYPTSIAIDGAFGDWQPQFIIDDSTDENPNENVDIAKYGSKTDGSKVSFYMSVDGDLMGGIMIPLGNPQIVSRPPVTPSGPTGPTTPVELPVNRGEDVVRIFLDTDDDLATGFNPYTSMIAQLQTFPLGADYMLEMSGKNGVPIDQGSYRFAGANQRDYLWVREKDITAAQDDAQLETQFDLGGLAIPANIRAYFWLSDVNSRRDDSNLTVTDDQVYKGTRNLKTRAQVQTSIQVAETAPKTMSPGETDDILRIRVSGGDDGLDLDRLSFRFTNDNGDELSTEEVANTFSFISIYEDNGDGVWSVEDTLRVENPESFQNGILVMSLPQGSTRIETRSEVEYFLVVTVSETPGLQRVVVDVEAREDVECHKVGKSDGVIIKDGPDFDDPVPIPEFHLLVLPLLGILLLLILVIKRKFKKR